jgi:hypothetical protein
MTKPHDYSEAGATTTPGTYPACSRARLRAAGYDPKMRWPQWYPRRGNVMSILFVIIVLCLVAFRSYRFPNFLPNPGNGFGPEWDCTANARGEPICIKKPGR